MTSLKSHLSNGNIALGIVLGVASTDVAEIVSYHCDWVFIDLEHSTIGINEVPDLIRTCELRDVYTLVRIPAGEYGTVNRVLDAGADGVIFPQIETAEEAEKAVSATRYPPAGGRGIGYFRAQRYGSEVFSTFEAGDDTVLNALMIESEEAMDNIEEILAVEHLDAVLVGPLDLAASRGVLGDSKEQPGNVLGIDEEVKRVARIARENGVVFGYPALDGDTLETLVDIDGQLIVMDFTTAILNRNTEQLMTETRSRIPDDLALR